MGGGTHIVSGVYTYAVDVSYGRKETERDGIYYIRYIATETRRVRNASLVGSMCG